MLYDLIKEKVKTNGISHEEVHKILISGYYRK